MDKVGVGVVGCGLWGGIHAQTYYDCNKAELVCVCDAVEERARGFASKYRCEYVTDSRILAENPEIRGVSITTPDFAHTEVALQMIEAGKDVLIEKPLTTKVGEAKKIVKRAKDKKVKVMVDFHNRWNPIFAQAKQAISQGTIGKPTMGYARLSNPLKVPLEMLSWSSKSGPEWFLLPHTLDLMGWLVEEKPTQVYASGRRGVLEEKGVTAYDCVQAMVKFENFFATLESSWILPDSWPSLVDFKLMLLGSEGRIGAEMNGQGVDIAAEQYGWPSILGLTNVFGKRVGFFREPIMHFVDCLLRDEEPVSTGEDGLMVTATIEAALRSIEEGRRVSVEGILESK